MEVMPRQSPHIFQHTNCVPPPAAGVSQGALNVFVGNLYAGIKTKHTKIMSIPSKYRKWQTVVCIQYPSKQPQGIKNLISDPLFETIG